MIITLGNIRIGSNWLYLVLVFLLLFTDTLFNEIIFGKRGEEGIQGKGPETIVVVTAFLFTLLGFWKLSPFLQKWALVGFGFLAYMVLESFYLYGKLIVFPHVFSKMLVMFVLLFLYPFFRGANPNQLKRIVYLICLVFFLHLLLFKRDIINIASFVNTERGFNAPSVYLLLLPCLYFINRYLLNRSFYHLFGFFVILFFIFFLQHRTVWIATALALVLNFILLKTKSATPVRAGTFLPVLLIPLLTIFIASSLVIAENPEFVDKLVKRVEDITNVQEQGTGSWRLDQFASYWPYIEQHFIAGMRYSGFELPIQFYQNNMARFEDNTGHHFHSMYVDKLFYFGLIGLGFFLLPLGYLIFRIIRKPVLSLNQMVIATFAITGLGYGLSYDWPIFFYGFVGIALAYLDREELDQEEEELPVVADNVTETKDQERSLVMRARA